MLFNVLTMKIPNSKEANSVLRECESPWGRLGASRAQGKAQRKSHRQAKEELESWLKSKQP